LGIEVSDEEDEASTDGGWWWWIQGKEKIYHWWMHGGEEEADGSVRAGMGGEGYMCNNKLEINREEEIRRTIN
jgi:hypothetical protein